MTLAQFVSRWLPDFNIAEHRLAGERARLIQERKSRVARHQSVRPLDDRLKAVTTALLKRRVRVRA